MNPAETWRYAGGDECADFFTACLKAAAIDLPADAKVLEIGCAEFDWLTPASQAWPEMTITGVDWRGKGQQGHYTRLQADVRNPELFAPESFDWIVSISAIEHVGLGHYNNDPRDADGDTVAIANAFRWLKPNGWLLFDVPYNPKGYSVQGTSHREYDDDALFLRLWSAPLARAKASASWRGTYYCEKHATSVLVEKPREPGTPFYYVGMAFQKVGWLASMDSNHDTHLQRVLSCR